ncbi:MAG: hypothetical protein ABSH48_17530 [Verrucomicrobiota bacterium]|jgi:hypothetical protein
MTLGFDGGMSRNTYKQFESGQYPCVTGKVTRSEVKSHRGSKGCVSYSAEITHLYTVGALKFSGSRLRFNTANSSSSAKAAGIVNANPVGGVHGLLQPGRP